MHSAAKAKYFRTPPFTKPRPVSTIRAPYTVALVKLEEGPLVTAQLTDLGSQPVEIGMPVEMVTRRLRQDGDERGMLIYGYKFRPGM